MIAETPLTIDTDGTLEALRAYGARKTQMLGITLTRCR